MGNSKEKKTKLPEVATVSHKNHRQRLYDRVATTGLENMHTDYTLEFILTLVLPRVDTNPIAKRLLEKFGCLSAVLDATPEELQEVRGIGKTASKLLPLIPQILLVYEIDKVKNTKLILTRGQAIQYCTAHLKNKPQEELYAICLDKSFKVLATKRVAKGSTTTVQFDFPELMRQVLTVPNVANLLLTHSHPNNAPFPSTEDKATTKTIEQTLEPLGISLFDHIIVGLTHSFSMAEGKLFEN